MRQSSLLVALAPLLTLSLSSPLSSQVLSLASITFMSFVCSHGSPTFPVNVVKFAWGALGGTIGGLYFFLKSLLLLCGMGGYVWGHWESYFIALGR